jgi:hypothetical protein
MLRNYSINAYAFMAEELALHDLLMHKQLLGCSIRNIAMVTRENSIEMITLRRKGLNTVADVIQDSRESLNLLCRIAEHSTVRHLQMIGRIYLGHAIPDHDNIVRLYDVQMQKWHRPELLSSKQIRMLLGKDEQILTTKLMTLTAEGATSLYGKIAKLKNVPNRTKMLRLLHGDVYCGVRLFKFGLSDSDLCIRCFQPETISHLLITCPYTQEVWARLGMNPRGPNDILENISSGEFEIRAEIINALVFRKKTLPPEVLLKTVVQGFYKGLSKNNKTRDRATRMVEGYEITGQWFT